MDFYDVLLARKLSGGGGAKTLWTFTNGYAVVKGSGNKVYRQTSSARACGNDPIENKNYVFTVTDPTKYNLGAYDVTSITKQTSSVPSAAVDGYYYTGGSKTISWTTSDSVSSSYVWLVLKKMDGTAFTDEELANGAEAVFTYTSN